MCLESKTIFPKIAKEDIICYKVIDIKGYSIYNRSYQYDEHKINKANGGSRLIKDILFYFFYRKRYSSFAYVFGILHSFAFKGYALNLFNNLRKDNSYTIWECVIPKGSLYFEGHYYEYGSRKLKLVRRIC